MKVLLITSQYPRPDAPFGGYLHSSQVEELRRQGVDVECIRLSWCEEST
jgi:hypothetical protein